MTVRSLKSSLFFMKQGKKKRQFNKITNFLSPEICDMMKNPELVLQGSGPFGPDSHPLIGDKEKIVPETFIGDQHHEEKPMFKCR